MPCLYTLNDKGSMTLIVLYVDEILVVGSNRNTVDRIKDEFKSRYKMKDLGEASEFLKHQPKSFETRSAHHADVLHR